MEDMHLAWLSNNIDEAWVPSTKGPLYQTYMLITNLLPSGRFKKSISCTLSLITSQIELYQQYNLRICTVMCQTSFQWLEHVIDFIQLSSLGKKKI